METPQALISGLPHSPGVYLFLDASGTVLYVGKAKDIRKRVRQYFQKGRSSDRKTDMLVSHIRSIRHMQTVSEFDALLLEAGLIHNYHPKYNIILKDDKSPLYVIITFSETWPHVAIVRRRDIPKILKGKDAQFGPFQSSSILRTLMKNLRHAVPYCTQKRRNGSSCFYSHIGLCHPCPSEIVSIQDPELQKQQTKTYRNNLFLLRDILSGKSTSVSLRLQKQMEILARTQRFEEAAQVKKQLEYLRMISAKHYDPSVYMNSEMGIQNITEKELTGLRSLLSPYFPTIDSLHRIECFDISNMGGMYASGSMVVLIDGKIDTSEYKRFKIRGENRPNDPAMIAEVIERRFRHAEWDFPALCIVDGGKAQVRAAETAMDRLHKKIPIIGLAKRYESIIVPQGQRWNVLTISYTNPALHIVQRIRDEAHRFALSYHRNLRKIV
jgi:excinuclease ABC subunit C